MDQRKTIAIEEWRRHGSIMPACLLGIMLVAVHGYTLGVMIGPLEREFGWSRADITIGPMIPSMAAIFLAPLVGRAVDRFGPRPIALFGIPFFCAALAALGLATADVRSWWALYALLGLASMFIFPTIWTAAINMRFDRNRGLALAIALAGTGITSAIFPTIASALLAGGSWRRAYLFIGLLCFFTVYPVVLLSFDRGARAARATRIAERAALPESAVRAEMLSARYLKLAIASFVFSGAACVLTLNAVPILRGEGFAPLVAAKIAGLIGIGSIIGRLGGGYLLDRFDARFVAAGSGIGPIVGAVLLLMTQDSQGAAMVSCVALGLAAGTEYDACAYLTARHFGMRNFGALFGLIGGLVLFAAGVSPVIANHVYDLTKSYDLVLTALIPIFAIASLLFLLIGPYPTNVEDRAPLIAEQD